MRQLSHWVGSWRCFQQLEKEFLLEGGSGWCVNPSTTDLKLQILLLSLNEAIGTITNIFLLLSISWLTVTFRLYHDFFNLVLVFLHVLESSKKKKKEKKVQASLKFWKFLVLLECPTRQKIEPIYMAVNCFGILNEEYPTNASDVLTG